MGVPRRLGSGVAWLQEVTPFGSPERWAVAPSSPAFVTASRGCQKELLHRFLKCFAVARTARCSASRASGKSRRHRAEPRRVERSLAVGAECGVQGGRLQLSGPQPSPPPVPLPRPPPPVRAAEPPGAEGSMLAVGCALLAALLAAPAVALVLGSCRPLGKTTWIGQRGCDMGSFRGQREPTQTQGARPGLAHLCGRGGGSRAPCCV